MKKDVKKRKYEKSLLNVRIVSLYVFHHFFPALAAHEEAGAGFLQANSEA